MSIASENAGSGKFSDDDQSSTGTVRQTVKAYLHIKRYAVSSDAKVIQIAEALSSPNNEARLNILNALCKQHEHLVVQPQASPDGLIRLECALQGGLLDNKIIPSANRASSASRPAVARAIATEPPVIAAVGPKPEPSVPLVQKPPPLTAEVTPSKEVSQSPTGRIDNPKQVVPVVTAKLTESDNSGTGRIPANGSVEHPIDPQLGIWAWKPLPTSAEEPDPHKEFDSSSGSLASNLNFIAARARGKKHKHEGTHCDDWYEVDTIGDWSLISVSDGAGSKRASRVGARSCTIASNSYLKKSLEKARLPEAKSRKEWDEALKTKGPSGEYINPELRVIQAAIVGSVRAAFDAVVKEFEDRKASGLWDKALGRIPELKDFRSTLLVSVLATVDFEGERRVLCLSAQVGDGLTVMYYSRPDLPPQPLAAKDSGEYSSETEFLVDFKKWDGLNTKVGAALAPFRTLISMTDGIDDIYDPRSGRDYNWIIAELFLNQVLPLKCAVENVDAAITDIGGIEVLEKAVAESRQARTKRLMEEPAEEICILDVGDYAKALSKTVDDLLRRPELMCAAHRVSPPISTDKRTDYRLLQWIDGKDVKGEFDDRTIVIVMPSTGVSL